MTINLEIETEAVTALRGVTYMQKRYSDEIEYAFAEPTFANRMSHWI
jgi:hypothetical protein